MGCWEWIMVSVWWSCQRIQLASGRMSVVHYDHRDSGGNTMFQICGAELLSFWKRSSIWRRNRFAVPECDLADFIRSSAGD